MELLTPTSDEKTIALLCHVGVLVPFLPLILWLIKKDESKYIDNHGKEATNFQITVFVAFLGFSIVFEILELVLFFIDGTIHWLNSLTRTGLSLAVLVLVIMAAVKTSNDESYQYPFNFRLIK